MQKIIEKIDQQTVRVTLPDERWYVKSIKDKEGIPLVTYLPSVTWICTYYPKGVAFFKWLASKGWDQAEYLKEMAAQRGSKIHQGISVLLGGEKVKMDQKFANPKTGVLEELTVDEYLALLSFTKWFEEMKPEVLANEISVYNFKEKYAGTIDLVCRLKTSQKKELWIIDFKTGQYIWPSSKLQLSAYKHANEAYKDARLAILQIGYKRNKRHFKFTEIEDKYDLFLAAKQIWENETYYQHPSQFNLPLELYVETNQQAKNTKSKA